MTSCTKKCSHTHILLVCPSLCLFVTLEYLHIKHTHMQYVLNINLQKLSSYFLKAWMTQSGMQNIVHLHTSCQVSFLLTFLWSSCFAVLCVWLDLGTPWAIYITQHDTLCQFQFLLLSFSNDDATKKLKKNECMIKFEREKIKNFFVIIHLYLVFCTCGQRDLLCHFIHIYNLVHCKRNDPIFHLLYLRMWSTWGGCCFWTFFNSVVINRALY